MSFIRKIMQSVFTVGTRFRTYEQLVLASTEAALGPRARMALRSQIERVSRIQRLVNDKDVSIYYDARYVCHDEPLRCNFAEYPLAVSWCASSECSKSIRATVVIVEGKLFSIVFNRSPGRDGDVGFNVLQTLILFDPSNESFEGPTRLVELGPLSQCVGDRIQQHIERGSVLGPLPEQLRERFLIPAADCVPRDYQNMLGITNGYQLQNWRVLGLPLREVAMEQSNMFILAESSDGKVLCATDGDQTRTLRLLDLEDESQATLGSRFKVALEALLSR
jgi:hypothetical protein